MKQVKLKIPRGSKYDAFVTFTFEHKIRILSTIAADDFFSFENTVEVVVMVPDEEAENFQKSDFNKFVTVKG
jgi:hypothetical protein